MQQVQVIPLLFPGQAVHPIQRKTFLLGVCLHSVCGSRIDGSYLMKIYQYLTLVGPNQLFDGETIWTMEGYSMKLDPISFLPMSPWPYLHLHDDCNQSFRKLFINELLQVALQLWPSVTLCDPLWPSVRLSTLDCAKPLCHWDHWGAYHSGELLYYHSFEFLIISYHPLLQCGIIYYQTYSI